MAAEASEGTRLERSIRTTNPRGWLSSHGTYIYTGSGHKVLDWTSGQMSCLLGHGHPEIVQAITAHAIHLDHLFRIYLPSPRLSAMGCHSVLL